MPHQLQAGLAAYRPCNEQEQRDLPLLRQALLLPDIFTRQHETAQVTASAWVVNPARERVLMRGHNLDHPGVRWATPQGARDACTEPRMRDRIYQKLIRKAGRI